MDWESFDVVKFNLGPFLQGQTRIAKAKSAYKSLFVVLNVVFNVKRSYSRSCARNLLI